MTIRKKLFRTIDIVNALTAVSIDRSRDSKLDELVQYVTGHRSMPKKGSRARQDVVAAIRSQLPCGINKFGLSNLIDLIMKFNKGQHEDQLRTTLIQIIEEQYGEQMTLSPEEDLETPSASLRLLRSLADHPNTPISSG